MARKKLDVLKNENYMNDAALSVLANRLNAVKKKNSYIWAEPRFNLEEHFLMKTDVEPQYKIGDLKIDINHSKIMHDNKKVIVPQSKKNITGKCETTDRNFVKKHAIPAHDIPELLSDKKHFRKFGSEQNLYDRPFIQIKTCSGNELPNVIDQDENHIVRQSHQIVVNKADDDQHIVDMGNSPRFSHQVPPDSCFDVKFLPQTKMCLDISKVTEDGMDTTAQQTAHETVPCKFDNYVQNAFSAVRSMPYQINKDFSNDILIETDGRERIVTLKKSYECSVNECGKNCEEALQGKSHVGKTDHVQSSDTPQLPIETRMENEAASTKFYDYGVHENNCKKESEINVESTSTKSNYLKRNVSECTVNGKINFQDWCLSRKINHMNTLQKSSIETKFCGLRDTKELQVQNNNFTDVCESNVNDSEHKTKKELIDKSMLEELPNNKLTKKRNRHNSTNERKNKVFVAPQEHFHNNSERSMKHNSTSSRKHKVSAAPQENFDNNSERNMNIPATMLSIVISVEGEKYSETMTEYRDLFQLKKNFPKFSEFIPDIDAEGKELYYSADSMKAVLGFLFNPSYKLHSIQKEWVALEILSLMRSWEILKFQDKFQKHVVENILEEKNASKIYSLAEHFSLHEIVDACKRFVINNTCFKYKQKKCFVAVSTYMDPIEFTIPLYSAEQLLIESFDTTIQNDIIFESISGNFIITGIQIRLNIDNSSKLRNSSDLKIFYSVKNITENLEGKGQKVQKSLSSKIFIYFNQDIILKSNQKARINIETDIKPCLCYAYENDAIQEKVPNGEFKLTLESNHRVHKSDKKSFFVGKLLYHVK